MRALLAPVTLAIAFQAAAAAAAGAPPKPAAAPNPLLRAAKPIPSPISDRFALRASYFRPAMDTDLRLDSVTGQPGTPLDGESDMGLDDRLDQGRAEFTFRLLDRHRIRVDTFRTSRYGEQRLTSPVRFGQQTFAAGDLLATDLDFDSLAFTYTYSAVRKRRMEVGIGLGVHLLQMDVRTAVRARLQRQDASATGVFPTVAIDGTYLISRQWSANARAQYLSGSANDFSGTLSDYHADVQYRWRPNFAVGLGYSALRGSFDSTATDFRGRFALRARGPELFLRVSF